MHECQKHTWAQYALQQGSYNAGPQRLLRRSSLPDNDDVCMEAAHKFSADSASKKQCRYHMGELVHAQMQSCCTIFHVFMYFAV